MTPFIIIYILLLLPPHLYAQSDSLSYGNDNSFTDMAGKPYREYSECIRFLYDNMAHTDSVTRFSLLEQLKETALMSGDRNLELEARLWETQFRQNEIYDLKIPYSTEDAIRDRLEIAEIAEKENRPHIRIKALQLIIEAYSLYLKNYDLTFEYLQEMSRSLEAVSIDEMPEKVRYLLDIGNLYYWFQDYERAERYYSEILKTPRIADRQSSLRAAYNGLALIYRHQGDLDRSDSITRVLLTAPAHPGKDPVHLDIWEGVARGNLGSNARLRGDYLKAIPDLLFARDKTLEHNDYDYASKMAIILADIYLTKGDLKEAKMQIDFAQKNIPKAFKGSTLGSLYPVLAKYYAAKGDTETSGRYVDSAIAARDAYNEEFHTIKLLRAEQRLHRQELDTEKIQSQGYRRVAMTVSLALALVTVLLTVIVWLYRKKRIAYRELARKSQQWAMGSATPCTGQIPRTEKNTLSQEAADEIMHRLVRLIEDERLYIDTDVTLDHIAGKLKVNRVYLSQAINMTGVSFTAFINEYRIKEAVKIMSGKTGPYLSIDEIAESAGFNDRTTFYRAFVKFTGLSPSQFRKNIPQSLQK